MRPLGLQRAQVASLHERVLREVGRRRRESDRAIEQQQGAGANAQCFGHVVVGQEDRSAPVGQVVEECPQLLGAGRVHAGEGLVTHEHPGPPGYKKRKETEQAWKVSLDEIKARNYNLDCKNPHVGEQEIHDPEVLLAQYNTMQADIAALRGQLKDILGEALQRGAKA